MCWHTWNLRANADHLQPIEQICLWSSMTGGFLLTQLVRFSFIYTHSTKGYTA